MTRASLLPAFTFLLLGGLLTAACHNPSSGADPAGRLPTAGRVRAQRDGADYVAAHGCPSRDAPINKLRCGGQGCGSTCDNESRLDYDFETVPGERYRVTFYIDDYKHNCADPPMAGLYLEGKRTASFKGKGTGSWAPGSFELTATDVWTRVGVGLENDMCCQCSNRCNPGCNPLYGDMNLYVERVVMEPLGSSGGK